MGSLHREMASSNRGGIRIHELVTAMDFYPTFASILGQPLGSDPSATVMMLPQSGKANPKFGHLTCLLLFLPIVLQAVRVGDWKHGTISKSQKRRQVSADFIIWLRTWPRRTMWPVSRYGPGSNPKINDMGDRIGDGLRDTSGDERARIRLAKTQSL